MKYCKKCGHELEDGNGFCRACGEKAKKDAEHGAGTRCIKCGSIIENDSGFCGACGSKALTCDEYSEKIDDWKLYKKLRFPYLGFCISNRVLLIALAGVIVLLIAEAIMGEEAKFISSTAIFILSILIFLLPLYILIIILRLVFKFKYNISYKEFELLKNKVKGQPEIFYSKITKPVTKSKAKDEAKTEKKIVKNGENKGKYTRSQIVKQRAGALAGLAAVVALIAIAISGQIKINKSNSISTNDGSKNSFRDTVGSNNSSSAKQLSGRWESTNGQTAMIFRGSTVYVGNKYNNDSDLISECKSWNKGIATYSISGNSITFEYKTGTYTYSFDGTTIYADNEKIKKE